MKVNLWSGAALCALGSMLTYADVAVAAEGDIIVTANRREQALQQVPLAVSSLSADSLTQKNIVSLSDIKQGAIAGVSINQFSGTPSIIAAAIRGHGTSDPTQASSDQPVAIYIDGVPVARGQATGLELIDPERVEILRGPQGQLFGRNAEAGAIQYVAKKPSGKLGFDASAGFGNYDAERYRLKVDLPEFANFKVQVAGLHSERGPFTKNPLHGTYKLQADYGEIKGSDGVRVAVRWEPTAQFNADYVYDDSQTIDSQPALSWTPYAVTGSHSAAQPASDETPKTLVGPLYNEYFLSQSKGHALTMSWAATDQITLKSITGYRETSRHGSSTLNQAYNVGSAALPLYANSREDVEAKQTSEELQFLGSFDRLDVTAGFMYFHEEATDDRGTFLTGPLAASGFFPGNPTGIDPVFAGVNKHEVETDSYGYYAQGTYTPPILDDKLEATLGIRYSEDSKEFHRTFAGFAPVNLVGNFNESRWDPAFTLKYNWTKDVNSYFRYATAYRAGGSNVRSTAFTPYGSEELESFEVGMKSRWFEKRLTANVSVYHNILKNEQLSVQEDPALNPALVTNINVAQDREVTGAELEMSFVVTPQLTATLSYSHMFEGNDIRDIVNPLAPTQTNRFFPIMSPDDSGSIALDYVTANFPIGQLRAHVDYSFSSDYWNTPAALDVTRLLPGFSRPAASTNDLSARLSWAQIPLGGTSALGEVSVWGKNLTDDNSILYGFDGADGGSGLATYRVAPLTAGVEFRVKY